MDWPNLTLDGVKARLSLDPRSLGLFRIALGCMLLLDAVLKFYYAAEFFSDLGVMPPPRISIFPISINGFSGSVVYQQALAAIYGLAAAAYVIGYYPRAAGAVAFMLLGSFHAHNTLLVTGAEALMKVGLFWSLFLPVGVRFSPWSNGQESRPLFGWATAAILGQLMLVYGITVYYKWSPMWTTELSAIYYALKIKTLSFHITDILAGNYRLTQILTAATFYLQLLGPPVALLTTGWTRFAIAVIFAIFHFMTGVLFDLAFFPFITAAYWILFWPPEIWKSAASRNFAAVGSRAANWAVAAAAVLTIAANLPSGRFMHQLVTFTYLSQSWRMFSADFLVSDLEVRVRSVKDSGAETELPLPNSTFWRIYLHKLAYSYYPFFEAYAEYLCRTNKGTREIKIDVVRFFHFPVGGPPSLRQSTAKAERECLNGISSSRAGLHL